MATPASPAAAPAVAEPARPDGELLALVRQLRDEVAGLSQRLAALESQRPAAAPPPAVAAEAPAAAAARGRTEVTEDDLVVISAAVAAFLGVRAQVRQVRLVQSVAWAQMGRATIHASHRI